MCASNESASLSTAAMPPCAYLVFDSSALRLVMTMTSPCADGLEREGQPGDAASDDEEVRGEGHGRERGRRTGYRPFRGTAGKRHPGSRSRLTADPSPSIDSDTESPFTTEASTVKILVAVKRVADPENLNKIKLSAQGKIDTTGLEPKASPYDEYALEAALRLTENGTNTKARLGEVVVVTFGPKEAEQMLRAMLGTGADRAIRVDATDDALDGDLVARGLKALVDKEKPDLVLLGYQQAESESNEVGQMLAEHLGWPQATFAGSIKSEDDKALRRRPRGRGRHRAGARDACPRSSRCSTRSSSPRACSPSTRAATHAYPDGVRFAALMAIMAAKKKPLAELKLAELAPDAALKVRTAAAELPPKRAAGVKVKDVKELVTKLKTEAKVI